MHLSHRELYEAAGLSPGAVDLLAQFGDRLLGSRANVTSLRDPIDIERHHFLDSLTLLTCDEVREAQSLVDVGSGGGLPAVVLAIALPRLAVTALESTAKKCRFIEETAAALQLDNLETECRRAEAYAREEGRGAFDVAVARAVAALPTLAELTLPLVRVGGHVVAMKGKISDQERMEGSRALAILGADVLQEVRVDPFPGAENRFLYIAGKTAETPPAYPRRPGMPAKRPLGRGKETKG